MDLAFPARAVSPWVAVSALAIGLTCKQREPQASTRIDSSHTAPPPQAAVTPAVPAGPTKPLNEWIRWSLADTGFGPIVIGMTLDQANAVVGGTLQLPEGLTDDACDYAFAR